MYQIIIKKSAAKEMELLPIKILQAVTKAILKLSEQPRPKGSRKINPLSSNLWRIRIGDYRVVYSIDDMVRIVDVKKVGHRKDIYD